MRGDRDWPLGSGRRWPGTASGQESTAVPGVEEAPTPVVSRRCGTWKPRSAAPCRRMLPSTGNCRPSNGCRGRVSLTVPGCTAVTGRPRSTTCTRRPAAWHTARAARAAFAASMHSAASRRSTGMPSARLAATSSTCRSPSEHGSIPCTASAAAAKSTAATARSRNGSHPTSTATCRKSSRSSHARCEISSSAAASVDSQPFAHARIASARSSKHVVRRGVL